MEGQPSQDRFERYISYIRKTTKILQWQLQNLKVIDSSQSVGSFPNHFGKNIDKQIQNDPILIERTFRRIEDLTIENVNN